MKQIFVSPRYRPIGIPDDEEAYLWFEQLEIPVALQISREARHEASIHYKRHYAISAKLLSIKGATMFLESARVHTSCDVLLHTLENVYLHHHHDLAQKSLFPILLMLANTKFPSTFLSLALDRRLCGLLRRSLSMVYKHDVKMVPQMIKAARNNVKGLSSVLCIVDYDPMILYRDIEIVEATFETADILEGNGKLVLEDFFGTQISYGRAIKRPKPLNSLFQENVSSCRCRPQN